jgi:hypothetical protein
MGLVRNVGALRFCAYEYQSSPFDELRARWRRAEESGFDRVELRHGRRARPSPPTDLRRSDHARRDGDGDVLDPYRDARDLTVLPASRYAREGSDHR